MAHDDNGATDGAGGGFSNAPPGEPVQLCGGGAGFDPSYTVDTVPKDLVPDVSGVYGYLPTPGTEFANSAKWPDWTDPAAVAKANATRVEYHQGLADKADWVAQQRAAGASEEDIARRMVDMRNASRMAMYSPEDLPKLQARNLREYGDPNGPSYEMALRKADGDPTEVIASALRSNKGVDVLCGICKVKEPGT